MAIELVFFYAFAGLAVFGALGLLLFVRNVVASTMSLVVTMVSLAGIYLLLEAHLIAVLQIIAYAGAIQPSRHQPEKDSVAISASDVKTLRDATGAGMMDCKKALSEAEGDPERALEVLRERGLAKAGKLVMMALPR